MAKITISHVQFRGRGNDQPRFSPAPNLRKLGFQPQALRHADGRWFDATEALAFITNEIEPEIERRRAAVVAGKSLRPQPSRRYVTVGEVIESYIAVKKRDGRPANTLSDYRAKRRAVETFAPDIYASPAEAIKQPIVFRLYEAMRRQRGLAMAVGTVRVMSAAYGYAMRTGAIRMLEGNPCANLKMQTPEPRVRSATIEEIRALIAAARHMQRWDVATMIALGVWTGQRQGDRLALVDAGTMGGRTILRQSKTRAIVSIPHAPELTAALVSAREAKASLRFKVIDATIVVNVDTGRTFHRSTYSHLFGDVRALAISGVTDPVGKVVLPPCPSLADFWEMDLRDTAVTWLVRAGCDVFEVASITGHDLDTVHRILKHYLAAHPERADAAITKMATWYEGEVAKAEM